MAKLDIRAHHRLTSFLLDEKNGTLTPMNSESIACQGLNDKGRTAVIAIMDDTVTDIILW